MFHRTVTKEKSKITVLTLIDLEPLNKKSKIHSFNKHYWLASKC